MASEEGFPFEIVETSEPSYEKVSVERKSMVQRLVGVFPGVGLFAESPQVTTFQGRVRWSDLILKDPQLHLIPGCRYQFTVNDKQTTGLVVQRFQDETVRIAVDFTKDLPEDSGRFYQLLTN
jgi:hypothetical protein